MPVPVIAIVLGLSVSASDAREITVAGREAIVLLVFGNDGLQFSTTDIVRSAHAAIEAKSAFTVVSPEQVGGDLDELAKCSDTNRLSCWTLAIRRHDRKEADRPDPRFLLTLGLHATDENRSRFRALWLDLDRSLAIRRDGDRTKGWEDTLEDRIFTDAVVETKPEILDARDSGALAGYFEGLIDRELAPILEREASPRGTIELYSDAPGLAVEIDGRVVGATLGGVTRVTRVPAGSRNLVVRDPAGHRASKTLSIDLKRSMTVEVHPVLVSTIDEAPVEPNPLYFWSGIGVLTLGTALAMYAALAPKRASYLSVCSGTSCSHSSMTSLATFCELDRERTHCGGGILAAPLGYSIAVSGIAFTTSLELLPTSEDVPWTPLLIGSSVGVLSYLISALARSAAQPKLE